MKNLQQLQEAFSLSVLRGTGDFDTEIAAQGAISGTDGIQIYRHAYRQRLRECIESDHAVLASYIGDELFEKLADSYIDKYPSNFPSLRNYCDYLPGFLLNTPPFNTHPIVSDIARFERILLSAFDAAEFDDKQRLDLSEVEAELWPGLVFDLHPSAQIYTSDWNAVQVWQAIKADLAPPEACNDSKYVWMVCRNRELLTTFRSLSTIELAIIETWIAGGSFADACAVALNYLDESDVSAQVLQILLSSLEDRTMSIAS